MEEIFKRAQRLKYTSFEYINLEDILDAEKEFIIAELEEIFLFKLEDKQCHIYWATETKEGFFNNLSRMLHFVNIRNKGIDTIYMEFIPQEFVIDIEGLGFKVVSEFVDYWIDDLNGIKVKLKQQHEVRNIRPTEYESAGKVTTACKNYSRGFRGETCDFVKEWNESDDSCILVSELNNEIAGVCFLNIYGFTSDKGPILWLRELAVAPQYHQNGIAHSLIAEALQWGQANGAKRSFLACDTENVKAIKIYEDFGYKRKDGQGQINVAKHF